MAKTAKKSVKPAKKASKGAGWAHPYQCNTLLSEEQDEALTELSKLLREPKSAVVRTAIMNLHEKEVGKLR